MHTKFPLGIEFEQLKNIIIMMSLTVSVSTMMIKRVKQSLLWKTV